MHQVSVPQRTDPHICHGHSDGVHWLHPRHTVPQHNHSAQSLCKRSSGVGSENCSAIQRCQGLHKTRRTLSHTSHLTTSRIFCCTGLPFSTQIIYPRHCACGWSCFFWIWRGWCSLARWMCIECMMWGLRRWWWWAQLGSGPRICDFHNCATNVQHFASAHNSHISHSFLQVHVCVQIEYKSLQTFAFQPLSLRMIISFSSIFVQAYARSEHHCEVTWKYLVLSPLLSPSPFLSIFIFPLVFFCAFLLFFLVFLSVLTFPFWFSWFCTLAYIYACTVHLSTVQNRSHFVSALCSHLEPCAFVPLHPAHRGTTSLTPHSCLEPISQPSHIPAPATAIVLFV